MRVPEELLVHLRRAKDLADRNYAEPLDLEALAAAAGVSKYHFLRCFTATYGKRPALYLAERRIERAQDLLRATNLTVTEVCMLVGYTSLGSFSSRSGSWWASPRPPTRPGSPDGACRGSPGASCSCTASATGRRSRQFPRSLGLTLRRRFVA